MKYDVEEIFARVSRKRRRFAIYILSTLLVMASALVVLLLGINDTLTFLMIVLEFASIAFVYVLFNRYSPFVLFSGEIKGRNVKEDEYLGQRNVSYHGGYKPRGTHIRLLNTGANRKRQNDSVIRSSVYLELESGEIACISDLYKSSTDLYEIGDLLVKYAGAKFPVIIGRSAPRQPCPLCGEINSQNDNSCRACGLKIIK